jgi:hypothetical protein
MKLLLCPVLWTSPLVQQCQKALNDISAQHVVGLYWVPGQAGVRGNEIADELARDGSVLQFVRPEPALGVSMQDIWRRIRCWLVNQHWVWWQGLGDTQRQAWELILGPCLGTKARFLSFNRTQSRAVTGLLTGHNTLRRHLHLLGLSDSPLCRRCGAEGETSAHILCECEVCHHTDMHIWAPINWYGAQRACHLRPRCLGTVRSRTQSQSQSVQSSEWINTFIHSFIQYSVWRQVQSLL